MILQAIRDPLMQNTFLVLLLIATFGCLCAFGDSPSSTYEQKQDSSISDDLHNVSAFAQSSAGFSEISTDDSYEGDLQVGKGLESVFYKHRGQVSRCTSQAAFSSLNEISTIRAPPLFLA